VGGLGHTSVQWQIRGISEDSRHSGPTPAGTALSAWHASRAACNSPTAARNGETFHYIPVPRWQGPAVPNNRQGTRAPQRAQGASIVLKGLPGPHCGSLGSLQFGRCIAVTDVVRLSLMLQLSLMCSSCH